MTSPPSLLYRLAEWLTGEPRVRQHNLQVLKIPADGTKPYLIQLNTIDIVSEGNIDRSLGHIPDFRAYWGTGEGFRWRDAYRMEIRDQVPPEVNGVYYGWRSFAMDLIPVSEQTGFCGDAFIAKTPLTPAYGDGVVYECVSAAFVEIVGSPLWKSLMETMHDREESVERGPLRVPRWSSLKEHHPQ